MRPVDKSMIPGVLDRRTQDLLDLLMRKDAAIDDDRVDFLGVANVQERVRRQERANGRRSRSRRKTAAVHATVS